MLPILTAANVDFLGEVWDMLLSVLGFGMFAVVFCVGGLLVSSASNTLTDITEGFHLDLDATAVQVVLKGLVAAAAFTLAAPAMPSFPSVVEAMLPMGDFEEITAKFAAREEGRFLINIFFDIALEQIVLSFAYFIPFILVDLAVSFLGIFLCDRYGIGGIQSVVLYIADIITLYAVNAYVLKTGTFFGVVMLEFLRSIRLSLGIGRFLAMLLLCLVMFFFCMRDVLTSDILVCILGVNITAALMHVAVTDSNRIYVLILAIICGLIMKLIRRFFDDGDSFLFDAVYALNALIATGLISALVFTVAEKLA